MLFVQNAAKLRAGCSITSDPTLSLKNARDQTFTTGAILSSDNWESFTSSEKLVLGSVAQKVHGFAETPADAAVITAKAINDFFIGNNLKVDKATIGMAPSPHKISSVASVASVSETSCQSFFLRRSQPSRYGHKNVSWFQARNAAPLIIRG